MNQARRDPVEKIRRHFVYDDLANRATLDALRAAGDPPGRSLTWMAHVVGAQEVWLHRLGRDGAAPVVWPDYSCDQCAERLDVLRTTWNRYLDNLDASDLRELIDYADSKGEPWSTNVEDILHHVLYHAGHHRGQIADALREAGHEPPRTDFIHFVRTGQLS